MKGIALAGIAGSLAVVTAAVVGRDRWHAAQANIRRYSMPGARSYDLVAGLLFRESLRRDRRGDRHPGAGGQSPARCRLRSRRGSEPPGDDRARDRCDGARRRRGDDRSCPAQDGSRGPCARRRSPLRCGRRRRDAVPGRVVRRRGQLVCRPPLARPARRPRGGHAGPEAGGRAIVWDVAPPHPTGEGATSAAAHGHGHQPTTPGHGSGEAPAPSLLATLRMLLLFRRLPAERYDFTKPAA